MLSRSSSRVLLFVLLMALVISSCSTVTPPPPSNTPQPTATNTFVPTKTLKPTSTPRPTSTPNHAATQQMQDMQAEIQSYFDKGYLETTDGSFFQFRDFEYEWAQLQWYQRFYLEGKGASAHYSDFVFNAHFKWSSAYRNADISGCGVAFAEQQNEDHYAVFLDRSKVLFAKTDYYYNPFGPTRGTGRVKFENPFDKPAEADFTLIVKDKYAYVLVDDELVGEYTLAESQSTKGTISLALISGTNKDYGTRCEMTNVHIFVPKK